jgi:lysophospholipase L1-like esterase
MSYIRWVRHVLVILLVSIILLEVALRVINPRLPSPSAIFRMSDPELGWKGVPDQEAVFTRKEFSVPVSTESSGFRSVQGQPDPGQSSDTQIALLGDSIAWGWGVADGETLADELQKLAGPASRVSNYGIAGYSTVQQLLLLERVLQSASPDIVLVLFFRNDLSENTDSDRNRRPWARLDSDGIRIENTPVSNPVSNMYSSVWRHSKVAMTLAWVNLRLSNSARMTSRDQKRAVFAIEPGEALNAQWQLYAVLMEKMRTLCTAARHPCELKLVNISSAPALLGNENAQISDRWLALCEELELSCLDVRDALSHAWIEYRAAPDNTMPIFYSKDRHLTATGHRVAAETIWRQLLSK